MAYDNIKLEKGLYTTGKSFTKALEELDPSENYKGSELEGLDAYERQLKRFDIKVSGANSDPVSKFFATTDSAALFPEYISRAVQMGIKSNNVVDEVVATTTEIDSLDYRSISCANMDCSIDDVSEGVTIPEFTIKLDSKLTKLQKHGKILVASYEAIKYQKLDLFTIMLKKIGDCIVASEFEQAIGIMIEDENIRNMKVENGKFTYEKLVKFWSSFLPYQLNALVVSEDVLTEFLSLPEFRDANAGLNFHATGNMVTPFGAKVFCYKDLEPNMIIGFDKNYAVEKVQAGGVLTEFDKLIDRQLERASISTLVGFSRIYDDSAALLTRDAAV